MPPFNFQVMIETFSDGVAGRTLRDRSFNKSKPNVKPTSASAGKQTWSSQESWQILNVLQMADSKGIRQKGKGREFPQKQPEARMTCSPSSC